MHMSILAHLPHHLQVKEHTASSAEDRRRFLDEMLVWREMAVHFVYYHPDNYDGEGAAREMMFVRS